jgi:hypothetical protein|eukprot:COSAG01_NODE_536_length_15768_cov_58.648286_7_plen_72_part_00
MGLRSTAAVLTLHPAWPPMTTVASVREHAVPLSTAAATPPPPLPTTNHLHLHLHLLTSCLPAVGVQSHWPR